MWNQHGGGIYGDGCLGDDVAAVISDSLHTPVDRSPADAPHRPSRTYARTHFVPFWPPTDSPTDSRSRFYSLSLLWARCDTTRVFRITGSADRRC